MREKYPKTQEKLLKSENDPKTPRKRPKIRKMRQKTTENEPENLRIRSKKTTNHPKNLPKHV